MRPGFVGTRTVVEATVPGTQFLATGFTDDWRESESGTSDIVFVTLGKMFKKAEIQKAFEDIFKEGSIVATEDWNINTAPARLDTMPVFIKKTTGVYVSVPKTNAPFEERIRSIISKMEPLFRCQFVFETKTLQMECVEQDGQFIIIPRP